MNTAEQKKEIDLYIESLPISGSYLDYEKAKLWFYENYPDASGSDYDRFNFGVCERLGI